MGIFIFLVVGAVVIFIVMNGIEKNMQNIAKEQALDLLKKLVYNHYFSLIEKRYLLIRTDSYGNQVLEDWIDEVKYFYSTVYIDTAKLEKIDISKANMSFPKFFDLFENALYELHKKHVLR